MNMKRILVIQSRGRQDMIDSERAEYIEASKGLAEVDFESALNVTRSWEEPADIVKGYDAVILGGSGEFDLHGGRSEDDPARMGAREIIARIRPFVGHIFANNIPVLGICFGHQLIADMHGGNVSNDPAQKKVGTFEVTRTEEGEKDPLFSSLPRNFLAQYGHKDSLTSLPTGATLLAIGPACKFSALRYGPKAYTVQFHPELTAKDVAWKLDNSPGYLPEGVSADSIVKESPEASQIIPLFIERIIGE